MTSLSISWFACVVPSCMLPRALIRIRTAQNNARYISTAKSTPTRAVMRRTRASEAELVPLCQASNYTRAVGGPWRLNSIPSTETSASFHEADREVIESTFRFADFSQAWSFMSRVALLCEKMNHHPEWSNTYNVVRINLTSHELGSLVSQLDVQVARKIDEIASEYPMPDE